MVREMNFKKFSKLMLGIILLCQLNACVLSSGLADKENLQLTKVEIDKDYELKMKRLYRSIVKNYTKVSAGDIIDRNLKNNSFVYIGRESCPFCREFVPMLNELLLKSNNKVYYLDTESDSKNPRIQEFYQKFSIDGVPALLYFKKDGAYEILHEDDVLSEWINKMVEN